MYFVGIDIGGTAIKAALIDETGRILESRKAPTPANDLEQLVVTLVGLIRGFQSQTTIARVGVGVPGLRSSQTRTIETSPHIPCLKAVNLEAVVQDWAGIPVVTENDANAGAYGEWACGASRGLRHMAYITLGTGLGCGLVLHGNVYHGASGYAGELGHTTVEPDGWPCACGSTGCLETRVSATGIVRAAIELGLDGAATAEAVHEAAVRGDERALSVFEETGSFLGMACSNLINLLNLEMIVIGGGVMASGDMLLGPARKEAKRRAFPGSERDCPIVQSQLWPDSGTIGAAMLARDSS